MTPTTSKSSTVYTLRSLSSGELNHLYRFWCICIFYRNCKKIWRRLRWIIKNSCKNTSEYMRISLPSHSCSYSVCTEIGRKIRGCIRVCLAFFFHGSSRAQPEMARASKADWVERMDSRACWYTSCKDDVKQHVECSWLLFLQFVVFSLWHAPCWFSYSWFLGEVTQPFLEPSEGARDRRIRTSAERDKWNGSIFSSLTLTPKLSWSKNSLQLLFSTRTGRR